MAKASKALAHVAISRDRPFAAHCQNSQFADDALAVTVNIRPDLHNGCAPIAAGQRR